MDNYFFVAVERLWKLRLFEAISPASFSAALLLGV